MLDTVLKNGAGGVLSNDISTTALLYSIEIVLLGERIVPTILPSGGRISAPAPSCALALDTDILGLGASLSARERQILHCLVDGLPNKLIARQLGITESTVKVHLKVLLRKLRIQNRTQAAVWALNHGFFQNDDLQIESREPGVSLDQEADPNLPDRTRADSVQPIAINGHIKMPSIQL
jgi:two-component system nitrate/nitrite response regulator NarL